jgi:hypothetical protein
MNNSSLGQDLKPVTQKYKTGVLITYMFGQSPGVVSLMIQTGFPLTINDINYLKGLFNITLP